MKRKNKGENFNSLIIDDWGVPPVIYNVILSKISGSATAGLFLSQLLYWWEKGRDKEWIYKTVPEIMEEIHLTRYQQETAIKKWLQLEVIKLKHQGSPRRRYFQIDFERLYALVGRRWSRDKMTPGQMQKIQARSMFFSGLTMDSNQLYTEINYRDYLQR